MEPTNVMKSGTGYTFAAIDELLNADVPPSDYAIATAKRLISDAGETKMIGKAHTSGGGEVRVEWRHGQRAIRLVVPSSDEYAAYIYYEVDESDDCGTEDITNDALWKWLGWVSG